MAHEYITDLPKNIAVYRRNQALIAKAERENEILERRIQKLENLDEYHFGTAHPAIGKPGRIL